MCTPLEYGPSPTHPASFYLSNQYRPSKFVLLAVFTHHQFIQTFNLSQVSVRIMVSCLNEVRFALGPRRICMFVFSEICLNQGLDSKHLQFPELGKLSQENYEF